jgi:hypothetical protein
VAQILADVSAARAPFCTIDVGDLSEPQWRYLFVVLDFMQQRRPITVLACCKEAKASRWTVWRWHQQPAFVEAMNKITDVQVQSRIPLIDYSIQQRALDGSPKHIEAYLRMTGRWNPGAGLVNADDVVVESPRSNLRGTAALSSIANSRVEIHVDSAGIVAADLLDWYRAFRPDVNDEIRANQYFTGAASFRGWPIDVFRADTGVAGGAPPATVEMVYCCANAVPANSRIENLNMRVVSPVVRGSDKSIMTS